jgi:hypothetical protein
MTESEAAWFDWAQDIDNFTIDPFAGFVPDPEPTSSWTRGWRSTGSNTVPTWTA